MLPIGPLMIEHRLIEKMVALINLEVSRAKSRGHLDPSFVDTTVDFMRFYADRTHHGKEEDILFRELAKKPLSDIDASVMRELVEDHKLGREAVERLARANRTYRGGDKGALAAVVPELSFLVDLYPRHIQKEDRVFFRASMLYFDLPEKNALLEAMWAFDRRMIHEKYAEVVGGLKQRVDEIVT